MTTRQKLPFVFLNAASTVDGKLAPHTRRFIPFSSRRDQELLFQLRTQADAVMSGARTVDLGRVDLGPGPVRYRRMRLEQGRAEYNLRIVVSGSASLDPEAEIFRHRFSPIIVLSTRRADPRRVERLGAVADFVHLCGDEEVDFVEALHWLRAEFGVRRLLCEGGGEVNAGLLRQGVVDEIHLTLSPLIFGGRDAPTLADGSGIAEVKEATRLRLKELRRFGDELFLVYRVRKNAPPLHLKPEAASETPLQTEQRPARTARLRPARTPRPAVKPAQAALAPGRSGERESRPKSSPHR